MHYSVLLQESINLLAIKPDGVYIDGTFGRGGHSREILAQLNTNGRLIAFDKDPQAIEFAQQNFLDPRFSIIHDSFANLELHLTNLNLAYVDGILLDLGVSSPQLDTPERGFSFRFNAPLDMRMNYTDGISAAQWLNAASEAELAEVFWLYGEEKFSRKIAKAIVEFRATQQLETTEQLANLIARVISYKEKGQHPATRVFQAIRIHINNELGDLKLGLQVGVKKLNQQGRMVVISFHSLEDRIVKQSFNQYASSVAKQLPRWVMINDDAQEYEIIAKKHKASISEINLNNRSRSAIMRAIERKYVKNC
ncbi:MAG: hypothetical protein RLZZ293_153 [Pseudomonadota bacterium]|jgi:16S rRNA (cytosine1402-N4)-methyltransferase